MKISRRSVCVRGSVIVEYGILLSVLGVVSALLIPPLFDTVRLNFKTIAMKIDEDPGYTGPVRPTPETDPAPEVPPTDPTDPTDPTYDPNTETGGGGGGGTTPPTDPTSPTEPTDPTNPTDPTSPAEGEKVCFGGTSTARPPIYRDNGDTVILSLGGDQLATFNDLRLFDTPEGRKIQAQRVRPIGSNKDIYLVKFTNVRGAVEVTTGQIAQIIAPNGTIVVSNMIVNAQWEYGLATGDEYVLFPSYGYIMDVRSSMNGNNNYTLQDQIGHPNFGDNDGEFDFNTAGCNAPGF